MEPIQPQHPHTLLWSIVVLAVLIGGAYLYITLGMHGGATQSDVSSLTPTTTLNTSVTPESLSNSLKPMNYSTTTATTSASVKKLQTSLKPMHSTKPASTSPVTSASLSASLKPMH